MDTAVYTEAFKLFFRCGVAHLEPYDLRRLSATCYFQVGVSPDVLATFGGWTIQKNMRDFYVEGAFVVPPHVRYLFDWLCSSPGVSTTTLAPDVEDLLPSAGEPALGMLPPVAPAKR